MFFCSPKKPYPKLVFANNRLTFKISSGLRENLFLSLKNTHDFWNQIIEAGGSGQQSWSGVPCEWSVVEGWSWSSKTVIISFKINLTKFIHFEILIHCCDFAVTQIFNFLNELRRWRKSSIKEKTECSWKWTIQAQYKPKFIPRKPFWAKLWFFIVDLMCGDLVFLNFYVFHTP